MAKRWILAVTGAWLATQALGAFAPQSQGSRAAAMPSADAATQSADEKALNAFREAVGSYLAVRKKISTELPPMKVTPHAAEINAASDALARAVQRARPGARQGAFFTPAVAPVIRRQLEAALRATDRASVLALINEEEGPKPRPTVHMRFPAGGVLASTPAILLQALPPLPSELEYRFIGRILVLRDIEAALVLDFMSPALPAS